MILATHSQAQSQAATRRKALDKLEARAVRVAKYIGAQLRAKAIVSLNSGHVPKVELEFLAKFAPLLAQTMLVANLQGRIDAKKSARRAEATGLKLANPSESGDIFAHTIEIMRKTLGPDVNLRALEERYNITALRTLKNVSDTVEKDVRETAYKLIEQGAHVKEAKQVLSERFDALGLTPKNPYQIETIFRTSSAVAYGAGSWAAYQDPDIQEILWGFQYTAVMDNRTRENHAAAEGVTLPKDDPFWQRMWPPNGYNCRCEPIPLYSPEDIVEPPPDAVADPGFGYNPGTVLGEITDSGEQAAASPEPTAEVVNEPQAAPEPFVPEPTPEPLPAPFPDAEKLWQEKMAKQAEAFKAEQDAQQKKLDDAAAYYKQQAEAHKAKLAALEAEKLAQQQADAAAQQAELAAKPKKKYKPRTPKGVIDYAFIKSYNSELGTLPDKKARKVYAWHKKLPYHAKNLLTRWFSTSKPMISAEVFLRTGEKLPEWRNYHEGNPIDGVKADVRVWNESLDKGMKHPTTVPLFRGMYNLSDAFYKMYTDVGGEFTWHATQATSRSSEASATGFTGGGDVLFKILKPKGAIEVAPIGLGGEHEVFTRAGAQFRVKSVEKNVIHSGVRIKTFITVEQITVKK